MSIAWGALAFGATYAWAYLPLVAVCGFLGVYGLAVGSRRPPRSLTAGLLLVACAVGCQLIPLPSALLDVVSPNNRELVARYDLSVAMFGGSRAISIDPARTWRGLLLFVGFGVFLLGSASVLTREGAVTMAWAILLIGFGLALIGIVQRAVFNGLIYGFWLTEQRGAPFGPFVNRNHFAGWMLMAVPVGVGLLAATLNRGARDHPEGLRTRMLRLSSKESNAAILLGVMISVQVLALVLTQSRSGMVSLTVAVAGFTVVLFRYRETRRMLLVAIYLLVCASAVAAWAGLDMIADRFMEHQGQLGGRYALWRDGVAIASDFWIVGTGLNTFGVATLFYQALPAPEHLREAHNEYLQLTAEGGLLLLIPAAIVVWALVSAIRLRLREDVGSAAWVRLGAVIGLAAIATQSLVDFSLQMPGNAVLFCALCAIALHDGRRL